VGFSIEKFGVSVPVLSSRKRTRYALPFPLFSIERGGFFNRKIWGECTSSNIKAYLP